MSNGDPVETVQLAISKLRGKGLALKTLYLSVGMALSSQPDGSLLGGRRIRRSAKGLAVTAAAALVSITPAVCQPSETPCTTPLYLTGYTGDVNTSAGTNDRVVYSLLVDEAWTPEATLFEESPRGIPFDTSTTVFRPPTKVAIPQIRINRSRAVSRTCARTHKRDRYDTGSDLTPAGCCCG